MSPRSFNFGGSSQCLDAALRFLVGVHELAHDIRDCTGGYGRLDHAKGKRWQEAARLDRLLFVGERFLGAAVKLIHRYILTDWDRPFVQAELLLEVRGHDGPG